MKKKRAAALLTALCLLLCPLFAGAQETEQNRFLLFCEETARSLAEPVAQARAALGASGEERQAMQERGEALLRSVKTAKKEAVLLLEGDTLMPAGSLLTSGKHAVTIDLNGFTLLNAAFGKGDFTLTNGVCESLFLDPQGGQSVLTAEKDCTVLCLTAGHNALSLSGTGTADVTVRGAVYSEETRALGVRVEKGRFKLLLKNEGVLLGAVCGLSLSLSGEKTGLTVEASNTGTVAGGCALWADCGGRGRLVLKGKGQLLGVCGAYLNLSSAELRDGTVAADHAGLSVGSVTLPGGAKEGYAVALPQPMTGALSVAGTVYASRSMLDVSLPMGKNGKITWKPAPAADSPSDWIDVRVTLEKAVTELTPSDVGRQWAKSASGLSAGTWLKKGGRIRYYAQAPLKDASGRSVYSLTAGGPLLADAAGWRTKAGCAADDSLLEALRPAIKKTAETDLHAQLLTAVEALGKRSVLRLDDDLPLLPRADQYATASVKKDLVLDGNGHALCSAKLASGGEITVTGASLLDDVRFSRAGRRIVPVTVSGGALGTLILSDCSLTLENTVPAGDRENRVIMRNDGTLDDMNVNIGEGCFLGALDYNARHGTVLNRGTVGSLTVTCTQSGTVHVMGGGSVTDEARLVLSRSSRVTLKSDVGSLAVVSLNNYRSVAEFTGNVAGAVTIDLGGDRASVRLAGTMLEKDCLIELSDAGMYLEKTADEQARVLTVLPYLERIDASAFAYADGSPAQLLVHGMVFEWTDGAWKFTEE